MATKGKDFDDSEAAAEETSQKVKFEPEEEVALLEASNSQKAAANKLYSASAFSEAIGEYDKALASCPNYLDYEVAVLKSNIAACHIKLEEWKEAVQSASAALEGLERLQPTAKKGKQKEEGKEEDWEKIESKLQGEPNGVVEIEGEDEDIERALAALKLSDERKEQIRNLRAKSLLRRARANVEREGWANLAAAEEDYRVVSQMPNLPVADQKLVRQQLAALPPRINAAKEREMGEMMGKLKELGNGILSPFGLSTDMFKFQKDEATGGYNMSFGDAKE